MSRIQNLINLAQEELTTAQLLLDNNRYRVCTSRAYYAIYYATQALLASKDLTPSTHRGMIQLFGQHFVKTGELSAELAKSLSALYDLRKLSDYDESCIITVEQAEQALASAKFFVKQVEHFLS